MKTKMRFIAKVLTIYLLSLPSILVFHSLTSHSENNQLVDQANLGDITLEDDSNCQFCNLYFDQQLFSQDVVVLVFDATIKSFTRDKLEEFFSNTIDQRYLRGPPFLI